MLVRFQELVKLSGNHPPVLTPPSQQDSSAEELADSALETNSSSPTLPSGFTIPLADPHIERTTSSVYCFMLSLPYSQPTQTLHKPQTAHNSKSVEYCEKFQQVNSAHFLSYRQRKWKQFQRVCGYLLPPGILTFLQLNVTVSQGCLDHIGEFILLQLAPTVIFTTLQLFQPAKQRC